MIASETQARGAILAALNEEFGNEGFSIRDDKLHKGLGHEGTVLGCYPVRSVPWHRDVNVQDSEIVVQFYHKYDLSTDPTKTVSPETIETYAERFRRKIQKGVDPRTQSVWYFSLTKLVYPDDPTGNKTRFEATLISKGNNSAIIETSE